MQIPPREVRHVETHEGQAFVEEPKSPQVLARRRRSDRALERPAVQPLERRLQHAQIDAVVPQREDELVDVGRAGIIAGRKDVVNAVGISLRAPHVRGRDARTVVGRQAPEPMSLDEGCISGSTLQNRVPPLEIVTERTIA